jgi:hypothetical protein
MLLPTEADTFRAKNRLFEGATSMELGGATSCRQVAGQKSTNHNHACLVAHSVIFTLLLTSVYAQNTLVHSPNIKD